LHQAAPAAVGVLVGLAVVGLVALPSNPAPADVPYDLIWRFRMASVAGAATYWSVTGMVFGWLRVRGRDPDRPEVAAAVVDAQDRS
jgi:predicted cobalt transporter CbtA